MTPVMGFPLGDGIELGPLEPWHAEQFLAMVEKDREHLKPWVPFGTYVTDVEAARTLLQRFADRHAADEEHLFGIWRAGELLGGVMFLGFSAKHAVCEIGVWIVRDGEGRGLITKAARRLIDWAIHERGMRRVQWTNNILNTRSSATAARLGMTREGLMRSVFDLNGTREDHELWAVVAEDWPPSE